MMNEKIADLREAARQLADDEVAHLERVHNRTYLIGEWSLVFSEKFAELIVRMCADYADMAQDADCAYPGDYVAEAMGYGVEEGITEWRNRVNNGVKE